jgi:hypothetical protein
MKFFGIPKDPAEAVAMGVPDEGVYFDRDGFEAELAKAKAKTKAKAKAKTTKTKKAVEKAVKK